MNPADIFIRVQIGPDLPVHLNMFLDGEIMFVKSQPKWVGVVDIGDPGMRFFPDGLELWAHGEGVLYFEYNRKYDFKVYPTLLEWLQSQNIMRPIIQN